MVRSDRLPPVPSAPDPSRVVVMRIAVLLLGLLLVGPVPAVARTPADGAGGPVELLQVTQDGAVQGEGAPTAAGRSGPDRGSWLGRFSGGLGRGLLMGIPRLFASVGRGVYNLVTDFPGSMRALGDTLMAIPTGLARAGAAVWADPTLLWRAPANAVSRAATWIAENPEDFGEGLGEFTSQGILLAGTGLVAVRAVTALRGGASVVTAASRTAGAATRTAGVATRTASTARTASTVRATSTGARTVARGPVTRLPVIQTNCFLAGTLIWTAAGLAPIETLVAAPLAENPAVITRSPGRVALVGRSIPRTFTRMSDHVRVLRVRYADGSRETFRTTDEHPFWVPGRGWTAAGDLDRGDSLEEADGQRARIVDSRRQERPEGVPVYNFEVAGLHTYLVGSRGILVHNQCQPIVRIHPTQRAARRAALRDAGIGRNGSYRILEGEPLHPHSRPPRGVRVQPDRTIRDPHTGRTIRYNNDRQPYILEQAGGQGNQVHYHRWGHHFPDNGQVIPPHYGVDVPRVPGRPTMHHTWEDALRHDPRLNQ